MPEQITGELPALYGGFSTQPKHQRHPTQVQAATNVTFSVKHGIAKRNGSRYIAYVTPLRIKTTGKSGAFTVGWIIAGSLGGSGKIVSVSPGGDWVNVDEITGTYVSGDSLVSAPVGGGGGSVTATLSQIQTQIGAGASLRLFPIYRDTAEQYLAVVATASVPRIFSVFGGPEAEVTCSAGALTYMGSSSAVPNDIRAFSIADTTIIANSKVTIAGNNGAGTITATTMPHIVTRTGTSPLAFSMDVATWASRTTGTTATNPLPTIWLNGTYKIADLCVHRERLMLGAGPRVQASQAGDYFNFWIEDASNLVDSDPIDISLPGQQIAFVDRLSPYRKIVVVFAKTSRQFELSSPDVLSASTAAFTPSTSYDTIQTAPTIMGNGLMFVAKNKLGATLYSYEYNDLQVASSATPLSFHIDGVLPNDITKLVSSSNLGFAACFAPSAPTTIYVYFEHWVGNQRAQEAWAKWTFPGFTRICDIAIIEGVLYVLGESQTARQYIIEATIIVPNLSSTSEMIAPSGGTTAVIDETTPVPEE